MSELQVWLLVLGIVVIAGVYAFNWLQERSHRRRAEAAFDMPRQDVLMERASLSPAPAPRFDEPQELLLPEASQDDAAPAPRTAARAIRGAPEPDESTIDCTAFLSADAPFPQIAIDELASATTAFARPVRMFGADGSGGAWVQLGEDSGMRYRRLKVAMQLADRQGVATRAELENFTDTITAVAVRIGAAADLPDPAVCAERAKALDALCADVDIAVGINVVAHAGQMFQGTSIQALAQVDGLRLLADGLFHSESVPGATQFTLDNQDTEPFFPETIKALNTTGVTFLLDVPRASGGIAAFDRMVEVARRFAESLDGTLVDDNRQILSDSGLDATRRALVGVYATMHERGIEPGGPVALRLFSG
jgi:FtsZ-interacting cell division protein ZipA